MHSVIISDYGTMLAKTGERLVIRGPRPRLELIEGGPQLFLPLDLEHKRPALSVVTSDGLKSLPTSFRRIRQAEAPAPLKRTSDEIELPLFRIGEIVIDSAGVSVSADLIEACCERGIRLAFLTRSGKPYAMLSSPMLTATIITRREQFAAYHDGRGVALAKSIVRGKLGNQAALLKYFGKYLKQSDPQAYACLETLIKPLAKGRLDAAKVDAPDIDAAREKLLSIEGLAGRAYWKAFRTLVPVTYHFDSREHRGASDPVNSALNYGYGILYTQLWGAIMNAGLEPFAGFLHVDRPGKPSLILDLVEEFRQPIVDRAILAAIGRGSALETRESLLTDSSRRAVAAAVLERIESEATFHGRRHKFRSIIQIQARNVASFLRGDLAQYRTFAFKW